MWNLTSDLLYHSFFNVKPVFLNFWKDSMVQDNFIELSFLFSGSLKKFGSLFSEISWLCCLTWLWTCFLLPLLTPSCSVLILVSAVFPQCKDCHKGQIAPAPQVPSMTHGTPLLFWLGRTPLSFPCSSVIVLPCFPGHFKVICLHIYQMLHYFLILSPGQGL